MATANFFYANLIRGRDLKVVLLGTGGPRPDPHRQGPSTAIEREKEFMLFDAGRGVCTQLVRAGIPHTEVDPIFITHHHFDHIGGLADLLLASWNNGRKKPIRIIGPEGTVEIIEVLLKQVYQKDINFRVTESALSDSKLANLHEIMEPRDVKPGLVHESKGLKVYTEYVEHGHGMGLSWEDWRCLGYRIEADGKVVVVSGDAVDCVGIDRLAKGADILVHCCYLAEEEITDHDSKLIAKYILASPSQVGRIAERAGARKLVLTHIKKKPKEMLRRVM